MIYFILLLYNLFFKLSNFYQDFCKVIICF
nr:MAG TPA: hypothetical protein [Caudoviricetes sp.]